MHLRDFVLIPMAQIAPYVRHPLTHLTVEQMLRNLSK
jgi:dihydroneopterin aldolase/2-amino-4-hydroxy-6-hydroxymethyldihydropteridine diphosphokinase